MDLEKMFTSSISLFEINCIVEIWIWVTELIRLIKIKMVFANPVWTKLGILGLTRLSKLKIFFIHPVLNWIEPETLVLLKHFFDFNVPYDN